MTLRISSLLLAILAIASLSYSAELTTPKAPDVALDTNKNTTLGDINIFGENAIGSMYVLWDNVDLAIEVKKSIQEKAFATDEFFMQNIDREQFEEERILRLFDDNKQQYFRLFPETAEEEEEEEE